MSHDHEHHHHDHPHGCTCEHCAGDHHHYYGEETALSVSLTAPAAYPPAEWERRMAALFERLFPLMELDGVAAGHLKGAVCAGEAKLFLSQTMPADLRLQRTPAWAAAEVIPQPTVTVNFISILPTGLTQDELRQAVEESVEIGNTR